MFGGFIIMAFACPNVDSERAESHSGRALCLAKKEGDIKDLPSKVNSLL